ncbi:MAG TPA: hypothetical protein VGK47_07475 [Nitrososphaeraceae archaeon]
MLVGNSTAREEQAPLQVKTLFSKYRGVENPTITEYISSVPDTLSEAVDLINSTWFNESFSATDYTLTNRERLSEYVRRFHTAANTLTPAVNSAIGLLSDPSSKLLVSIHQPNLFAYGGVYKKILLLETLKDLAESKKPNSKLVNLFLIVDHDFLDDIWMRTAQLPSIRNKGGVLEIRTPVSNTKRWQMVCNTPPPHKQILESWRKQLKLWIKNAATNNFDKSVLLRNFEALWTDVEGAFIRSKSYSDFNAFFQSRVVNGIWGYKTLFVRLSDISPVFDKGFEFLLSGYDKYSRAVEKAEKYFLERNISTGVSSTAYLNAPVWIHCKCGSKASAKVREDKVGIILRGKCMSCKSDLQIDFENTKGLKLSKEVIHKVSPRAIPILLLLSKELGIGCYASGTGGSVGYAIVGSLIFKELSIKMPLTVVWPADDMYVGLGQSEALEYLQLRQRSDVIDYLRTLRAEDFAMSREIRPMLEERNLLVNVGQPIDEILSKLFKLKERQRKIHSMIKVVEKVRNSLQIKPCFLDYGINFGVKNTEANWRNNLIKNNNLMLPLHLTSNV